MSAKLPNGSQFAIAAAYGSSIVVSALSNAAEAVASLATGGGTGLSVGDIVELSSGWSGVDGIIARIKAKATDDITLEGIDTSDTTKFPAGSGTGSIRVISSWTALSQIMDNSYSGGEQQFATFEYLEESKQHQIPTFKTAESISVTLADDPTKPWFTALQSADDGELHAMRVTLANGSLLYYNCYVSFNKTPTLQKNTPMGVRAVFSLAADPTRYTS